MYDLPGDSFWEKWAYETYLLYLLEEGSRDVMMSLPKERFWKVFSTITETQHSFMRPEDYFVFPPEKTNHKYMCT